jgi:putative MATE family efflux protein
MLERSTLLENTVRKELTRLAIPMTLVCLLQMGNQLIDAFWVGRLGAVAVAAVSVTMPVAFIIIAAGAGLAMAGATLTAQYSGAGRKDIVDHIATQTMLMVAAFSITMSIVGYLMTSPLLTLLGVEPDVYESATQYMHVLFISIIPLFLFAMFQALMRGVGEVKIPLIVMTATVILNFILDPFLIFEWKFFPGLGVKGAALATLATESLATLCGCIVLIQGRHGVKIKLKELKPDFAYIKKAFMLGMPASVEHAIRGLSPMAMSYLAIRFGTKTIASYGIGTTIMQFISIPAMGLSMAASTLVGQSMGRITCNEQKT